jgi:uncharacterized caspase-like protein
MRWIVWLIALMAVLAAGMGNAQAPAKRIALVIGNAAYEAPGWRLQNPVRDASLIAERLRSLGFRVDTAMDASKVRMEEAMAAFVAKLRAAGPDAVSVFYYAGHGVESDGANLLVPVDVAAESLDELRYQAPPMQFLLRDMARIGNPVNIVILDACRNLPLPSGTRDGPAGGLANLDDVPTNVLIVYATRPGLTAPDNPGEQNSVFTRTLAEALERQPSETLVNLLSDVQSRVFAATGARQRPEFRSGLLRAPSFRLVARTEPQPSQEVERQLREARDRIASLESARTSAPAARAPSFVPYDIGLLNRQVRAVVRDARALQAKGGDAALRARRAETLANDSSRRGAAGERGFGAYDHRVEGTSRRYSGAIVNGKASGYGIDTNVAGEARGDTSAGLFRNGYMVLGVINVTGARYEGETDGGRLSGHGVTYYRTEPRLYDRFDGLWRSGAWVRGVTYLHDGRRYEGDFVEDASGRRITGYGAEWDREGRLLRQGIWEKNDLVTSLSSDR